MEKIICNKCKKEMENLGNIGNIVYTSSPPQWDEVHICRDCKTKKTIRMQEPTSNDDAPSRFMREFVEIIKK